MALRSDSQPGWAQQRRRDVRVSVRTTDPLDTVGLLGELRDQPGIELVGDSAEPDVVIVVAETGLRDLLTAHTRLILVASQPRQADLWTAVQYGLCVLLPRSEATPTRLLRAISDACHGRGELPPDQLGWLLRELSRLHRDVLAPRDIALSTVSTREAEMLRLLADGLDTADIAAKLSYSERSVKNFLQEMFTRLGLRGRTHAVAYAIQHGLI